MDTSQKAPIIVTQSDGTPVTGFASNTDNSDIGTIEASGSDVFLVAQNPGSANLNVTKGAQTGTLPFTVTAAPLTVTLGAPVPK